MKIDSDKLIEAIEDKEIETDEDDEYNTGWNDALDEVLEIIKDFEAGVHDD